MVPGEGPLVEVLPNGQTVDEVMQDIAGGERQSLGWWDGGMVNCPTGRRTTMEFLSCKPSDTFLQMKVADA